jgi:type IV secretory pathway VirB10-like protein
MFSKSVAVGVLALGCVVAAASGAYLAIRHNAADPQATVTSPGGPSAQPADAARPVAETEAVVNDPAQKAADQPAAAEATAASEQRASVSAESPKSAAVKVERETPRVAEAPRARPSAATTATPASRASHPPAPEQAAAPVQPRERRDTPEASTPAAPAPPTRSEVVPASSVIGLRVETPISTEKARLEDRVNGRVTRDVMADGRVAIPAGAQAIGSVTLVERGGKIKERARLGVRFHTLVLADGTELPISTEAIYREGEPPAGESTRKIGGAAVGGAILGALIGGKKGALVGATTGAAGGTAVVMAGDRNAATLPTGTIVTVRLAAPVSVEVEKR